MLLYEIELKQRVIVSAEDLAEATLEGERLADLVRGALAETVYTRDGERVLASFVNNTTIRG